MSWEIEISPLAKKRISKIPQPEKRRILLAIANLKEGFTGDIKLLKGCKDWRLRVGKWRIIFSVNLPNRLISIEYIDVRGYVYKK